MAQLKGQAAAEDGTAPLLGVTARHAQPAQSEDLEAGPVKDLADGDGAPFGSTTGHSPFQLAMVCAASVLTAFSLWHLTSRPASYSIEHVDRFQGAVFVACRSWVAAACSSLGVVPFLFVGRLGERVVAVCNAVAAGVMLAASAGLVFEGSLEARIPTTACSPVLSVVFGFYLGIGFIKFTEAYVHEVEPATIAQASADTRRSWSRVVVMMAAMTVHAFSEGVGIGVAHRTQSLGSVVSAALALHNVPEAFAIALVLIPKGFSRTSTTLWCIFASLPQPLFAVPAYLLVDLFQFITPIGCAFAAGAMTHVSIFELLHEAKESLSAFKVYLVTVVSFVLMGAAQVMIKSAFA